MPSRQKVKILKITKTGDNERGKTLMLIEDDSIKSQNRYAAAIAPKNYNARAGEYISKTEDINYINAHMGTLDKERDMYEKLRRESR